MWKRNEKLVKSVESHCQNMSKVSLRCVLGSVGHKYTVNEISIWKKNILTRLFKCHKGTTSTRGTCLGWTALFSLTLICNCWHILWRFYWFLQYLKSSEVVISLFSVKAWLLEKWNGYWIQLPFSTDSAEKVVKFDEIWL